MTHCILLLAQDEENNDASYNASNNRSQLASLMFHNIKCNNKRIKSVTCHLSLNKNCNHWQLLWIYCDNDGEKGIIYTAGHVDLATMEWYEMGRLRNQENYFKPKS